MRNNVKINLFILLIGLAIPKVLMAEKCRPVSDLTKVFFINGVGNTADTQLESARYLKELVKVKEVIILSNPMNSEYGDFLRNKLGTPFTWDEIKEVFAQKRQEVLKESVIDKNTVESLLNSLDKERVNIVIAHSQGNLYANSLCLMGKGKFKQKNIAIATPASSVECGDSKKDYITLTNDLVIMGLGTLTEFVGKSLQNPLEPNMTIIPNKNDLSGHGLVETYLSNQKSRKHIQVIYNRKLEESKKEELDFNFIELHLTKLTDEDKSIFRNMSEGIDERYTNTSLTIRQNMAILKVLGYMKDVLDSGFFISLMNLRLNSLNKKELNKVFDLPIQVSSDREYADVVGYVLDTIYPHCRQYKSFLPQGINDFCGNYSPYFIRKQYKDFNLFDQYYLSGTHKNLKWNSNNNTLSLKYLDALKDTKDIDITLNYYPESNYSSVMIDGMEFKIHPRNLLNKKVEKQEVLSIQLTKNQEKIIPVINKITDELNLFELTLSEDNYKQCNTLNKLFQNDCKDYFISLMMKNHR